MRIGKTAKTWCGRGIVFASCLIVTLLAFAVPAEAARIHPLLVTETLPEGGSPFSVAVNQETHQFSVMGFYPAAPTRVLNFEANGEVNSADPELTLPSGFRPFRVAIDNSGAATDGFTYAVDVSGVLQQFDTEGKPTAVTVTASSLPPNGTPQEGGLPPVVNEGGFNPRAVAVDGTGDVFVTDPSAQAIDVFDSSGTFVKQLRGSLPVPHTSSINGLAFGGSGDIYLASSAGIAPGLFEINPSGECVPASCEAIDPAPINGVAFDAASGTIFTTSSSSFELGEGHYEYEGEFSEYDASTGALLGTTRPPQLHDAQGIAVNEESGEVIVASLRPTGEVQIYGAVQIVPDVRTLPPSEVESHSATLNGEIGAAGVAGASCAFQYVDDAAFEEHRFQGAPTVPCEEEGGSPAGPFSGEAMNTVQAHLEGLRGGTTYHERILGTNENGSNPGEDTPFMTAGPSVSGSEAVEVGEVGATLKGFVNPRESATAYRFEYETQARYEANPSADRFAGAAETPSGGEAIGSGGEAVEVRRRVEGLLPGTAYRFRLVAVSAEGETTGEEVGFSTYASFPFALPDGRRYEQASPVEKNGANLQGAADAVEASLNGDRVTFFANTGIPGGEGSQQFPTYMATRDGGEGWSTHGLLPSASYGPHATVLGWSQSLEDVYTYASRPVEEGQLLRRSSGGGGQVELASIESVLSPLAFGGSSRSGAVALLESKAGGLVPGDLAGKQNLYAYDRESGALAVAGVMNDGSVPPGGAMAGPYPPAWKAGASMVGGALGFSFLQDPHAISSDGSRIFFSAAETGQLYARLNPLAAQSAMSGGECTEAAKACTVRVSAPEQGQTDPGTPAGFVGASADGRLVYFLDRGKLTTDATGGAGFDLYRYDLRSGALTDLTLDTVDREGARVEGLLGMTADESGVYFAAVGQLAEGAREAPRGETNLYLSRGGEIQFVTRLDAKADEADWMPAGGYSHTLNSRVSADGQTLLFSSVRRLTSYDNHGVQELYLYRPGQGISCVSCNPTSEAPAGPAALQKIYTYGFTLPRNFQFMTRNLSPDGRRVIFDSADRLVAADHNDVNDVYEWETPGKGSCTEASNAYVARDGGCLYLISGGGAGAGPSYFGDADEEGENVFFFTAQQLVAQDKDELVDVYDARVGGGIAAQEATPAPPCEGEACLGAGSSGPASLSPSTSSFAGGGNISPQKRSCSAPAHRAQRLAHRARALLRRAHRVRSRRRARWLRRRAHRVAHRARRLRARARRCRGGASPKPRKPRQTQRRSHR